MKIYLPLSVGDIDGVADRFENNGKPLDKGKAAQYHSYMYRTEIRRSRCLKNKFLKLFFYQLPLMSLEVASFKSDIAASLALLSCNYQTNNLITIMMKRKIMTMILITIISW